ncbi:hypothetical protein ACS0TY_028101 [Phlomoides rotata]
MASSKTPPSIITSAVLWRENEGPKLEEIEVEGPKAGEVRVKMLFASICHTDVLAITATLSQSLRPRRRRVIKSISSTIYIYIQLQLDVSMYNITPIINPINSVVESVGEGVKELKEGDTVMPTYLGECRDACENCRSGKTNLCQTFPLQAFTGLMRDNTSRMRLKHQQLYHFLSCSTWSEYTVVDANYLVKIDPRIPLAHASFLSCGFTTGFGAVWKEAKIEAGSTVAVLGLGAVGLGVVEGARLHGAHKIIGVDVNDSKREIGEVFGMTHFVNPMKHQSGISISESVKQVTGGSGVDYSFECTGVARLVNEALEATKIVLPFCFLIKEKTCMNTQEYYVSCHLQFAD